MENVMAVGDSQNDEDFLREVGYKIAVANADEKLKYFGITNKISTDAILKKERFTF